MSSCTYSHSGTDAHPTCCAHPVKSVHDVITVVTNRKSASKSLSFGMRPLLDGHNRRREFQAEKQKEFKSSHIHSLDQTQPTIHVQFPQTFKRGTFQNAVGLEDRYYQTGNSHDVHRQRPRIDSAHQIIDLLIWKTII
jgi:hypothetical protein